MIHLLLLLSFLISGCDRLFLEEDLLRRPKAKRCGECHTEILREWEESRHRRAWESEKFREESENYSKRKCLPCHAPVQVYEGEKPELRGKNLEDGVSCVPCHFKEETEAMHGPLEVWSPPHPSRRDSSYERSNFCGSCHRNTFEEWKRAGVEKTCQDCHMPFLGKRDLIQKFPYNLFHLAKRRHDHRFPPLKAKGEDLSVRLEGSRIVIENTGVPHNLPTADHGDPKLYLIAEVRYRNGKVRRIRRVFSPQTETALPYREPRTVKLPKGRVEEVRLRILRRLSWRKKPELVKEVILRTPSP